MKKCYFTLCLFLTLAGNFLSAQSDCLTLRTDHIATAGSQTVCVDIKVDGFQNILGAQFTLRWDDDVLAYKEVTNFNLPDLTAANFGVPASAPQYPDQIRFFWFDKSVSPLDLPDDTAIFSVCFDVIGSEGSFSPIEFYNDPTLIEISGQGSSGLEIFSANLYSGSITVGNTVPDLPEIYAEDCPSLVSCSEVPPMGLAPMISNGTPPYLYSWTGPAGFTSNELVINDLMAGSYTLIVEDANQLSNSAVFQVGTADQSSLIITSVKKTNPEDCQANSEGAIAFSVQNGSGAYAYLWNDGVETRDRTGLSSGIYQVTVTDLLLGCSVTREFTLVPATDVLLYRSAEITPVSCGATQTGSIKLAIGGAYEGTTVKWSTGDTGTELHNLPAGSYSAMITTTDGCTFEWFGEVEISSQIQIGGTVGYLDCGENAGYIELEVPGEAADYTYLWSNGATTKDIGTLSPDTYEVTVTNQTTGCAGTQQFEVFDGKLITGASYECVVQGQTLFAKISAAVWAGGSPPYTFNWSNGDSSMDDLIASTTISLPGTVTLTITDSKGCTKILDPITPDCNGQNDPGFSTASEYECIEDENGVETHAKLTYRVWEGGTPPYTFSWSNGVTETAESKSSIVAPADAILSYTVTVTDQLGRTHISHPIKPICQIDGQALHLDVGEGAVSSPGESVCIPLVAKNFDKITSFQFSMSWDPSQLVADTIINSIIPSFSSKNYNLGPFANSSIEGAITFAWFDPQVKGVDLPDGSTLFEVCFTAIGDDAAVEVLISNHPTPIEVVRSGSQIVPLITSSGLVTIGGGGEKLVWPGDTDHNGLVDHFDLLNIGLAYGASGFPRPDASLNWEAQFGVPWSITTPNTQVDYRHIDSDGNGQITANDTLALALNYGLFNDQWNGEDGFTGREGLPESARNTGTPLFIDTHPVENGSTAEFDIVLGDAGNTENTVYGLAFSIDYDPLAIVPGSIKLSFGNSWMGQEGQNLLTFYRVDPQNHRVNVAITRTDGLDITGSGPIAQLLITIEDVIFRSNEYEIPISIEKAHLITAKEEAVPVQVLSSVITVATATGTLDAALDRQIKVYPVPARDLLFLRAPQLNIEAIGLYDLEGRPLQTWLGSHNQLSLPDLPRGAYMLRLITDRGVAVRRIIIMD